MDDTLTPVAEETVLYSVRRLDHPDVIAGLAECPRCSALVLRSHVQAHTDWHATLKTSVAVAGFGFGGIGL